jgi:hypothetical protein
MAQSVICGTSGNATIASRGARLAAWTINLNHELNDATGFGGSGWRQNKTSLKSASGSASGFLTKGTSSDTPNFTALSSCSEGEAITLTADTGCTYTFTGNISNIAIGTSVAGLATVTFDFVSNGTVTEAWVTS